MRNLEKIVKDSMTANKCKFGSKEVLGSIKGSKLIILSNSVSPTAIPRIINEANANTVPILEYEGNSVALGRICNKPFRVSAISLKTGDEEEIQHIILNSKNSRNR